MLPIKRVGKEGKPTTGFKETLEHAALVGTTPEMSAHGQPKPIASGQPSPSATKNKISEPELRRQLEEITGTREDGINLMLHNGVKFDTLSNFYYLLLDEASALQGTLQKQPKALSNFYQTKPNFTKDLETHLIPVAKRLLQGGLGKPAVYKIIFNTVNPSEEKRVTIKLKSMSIDVNSIIEQAIKPTPKTT